MKASSKKQKGRQLVKWGLDAWKPLDSMTYEVSGSGAGLSKADQQLPNLGIAIEWKNWERYDINQWLKDRQNEEVANNAVIIGFRDVKSPTKNPEIYYIIKHEDLFKLLSERKQSSPDIQKVPRYDLEKLREQLRKVLKYVG